MVRKRMLGLLAVLLFFPAMPSGGQGLAGVTGRFAATPGASAEGNTVSLGEAVGLALENNHEIRASQNALSSLGKMWGLR